MILFYTNDFQTDNVYQYSDHGARTHPIHDHQCILEVKKCVKRAKIRIEANYITNQNDFGLKSHSTDYYVYRPEVIKNMQRRI